MLWAPQGAVSHEPLYVDVYLLNVVNIVAFFQDGQPCGGDQDKLLTVSSRSHIIGAALMA